MTAGAVRLARSAWRLCCSAPNPHPNPRPAAPADPRREGGAEGLRLEGLILRNQLLVMLQRRVFCDEQGRPLNPEHDERAEVELEMEMRTFFRCAQGLARRGAAGAAGAGELRGPGRVLLVWWCVRARVAAHKAAGAAAAGLLGLHPAALHPAALRPLAPRPAATVALSTPRPPTSRLPPHACHPTPATHAPCLQAPLHAQPLRVGHRRAAGQPQPGPRRQRRARGPVQPVDRPAPLHEQVRARRARGCREAGARLQGGGRRCQCTHWLAPALLACTTRAAPDGSALSCLHLYLGHAAGRRSWCARTAAPRARTRPLSAWACGTSWWWTTTTAWCAAAAAGRCGRRSRGTTCLARRHASACPTTPN
jgi:hypothetical protein